MDESQSHRVFRVIGEALNLPIGSVEVLSRVAKALVEELGLKGCHFRMLSRDEKVLEHVAAYGLSEAFLNKGPVDAERSVAEALKGKVVAVADCTSDPRIQYPQAFAAEGIASLLTVPLATRGQVVGVMRLFSAAPREFSEDEVEFLRIAALFCSSAIVHAMFHEILEHVTHSIRSSLDLQEVLNSIVRVVAEDLRAKGCSIRLLDAHGDRLELLAAYGLSQRYLDKTAADPGSGVYEALRGACVDILDAAGDERIKNTDQVTKEKIASVVFVPLMVRDQAIGVLSVYTHRRYEFSEDEIELLSSIGEQCALAIRNAQMYDAIKRRYESVTREFQQWFEQYYVHP